MPLPSLARACAPLLVFMSLAALVLSVGLLPGLLSACAAYGVTRAVLDRLGHGHAQGWVPRLVAFAIVLVPVSALVLLGSAVPGLLQHAASELEVAVQKLRGELPVLVSHLPMEYRRFVPQSLADLQPLVLGAVRGQLSTAASMGASGLQGVLLAVVGLIIGTLAALDLAQAPPPNRPLSVLLVTWGGRLISCFNSIVVAQIWIAGINTLLTAVFLFAILPLFGVSMPFAHLLLALTFVAGLLPIVGNLICNVVLTLVALSVGPLVAAAALLWLVLIHKLEFVISAKVVGAKIGFSTWELLVAMLALQAVFGVPGLVAAPLLYALTRLELKSQGWV